MKKTCTKCGFIGLVEESFYLIRKTGKYESQCRTCRRERNNRAHAANREKYRTLNKKYHDELRLKVQKVLGGCCAHCGITDHRVLEIDHIDGGGRQEQLLIGVYGIRKKILKDSTGYQLLCSNCHTIKTWHEEGGPS